MPLEILEKAPVLEDYIPLADHESQTPTSFFGGKPVLHAHLTRSYLLASHENVKAHESLEQLWSSTDSSTDGNEASGEQNADRVRGMLVVREAEVFVGSDYLILTKTTSSNSSAAQIPYPSISLHAVQRLQAHQSNDHTQFSSTPSDVHHTSSEERVNSESSARITNGTSVPALMSAIYLQIDPLHHLRAQMNEDEDAEETAENGSNPVTILIVPNNSDSSTTNTAEVQRGFEALNRCADLHPDEAEEGDEISGIGGIGSVLGGGLGQGGWITAENAHEFQDDFEDNGEDTAGRIILGPGAGSRRARAEDEIEGSSPVNGHPENGNSQDEAKWRRTD